MIRWQTGKEIHLDIEHSKNYEHTVALVKTCFVSESDLRAVVKKLKDRGLGDDFYVSQVLERELFLSEKGDGVK